MERGTASLGGVGWVGEIGGGGAARKSKCMSISVYVCVWHTDSGSTADSQSLSPPLEAPSEVTVKAKRHGLIPR